MTAIEMEIRKKELVDRIINEADEAVLNKVMSIFKNDAGVPENYMSSENFWKVSRERLDIICKKHGILQDTGVK